jgi:hypothetical protein
VNFSVLPFLAPSDAASIDPTLYANLAGWWDANFLGYADATPIDNASAKWTDRSSNANHMFQATAANQPKLKTSIINSKKVVRFDSLAAPNNDILSLTSAITLSGNFTVIAVGLVNADSILFSNSGANEQFRRYTSSAEVMSLFLSATQTSSTLATAHGTAHMMSWRRSGSGIYFRVNKTDRTTGSPSNGSTFTINQMSKFDLLSGDIGEVIIYSAYRSDAECDNLYDAYLKPKWGLP